MAVISPWTGAGDAVSQQVRQRVVDQLTFAQKQQDMDLANRRQAMLEQEAQQRADEHQANMASLAEQRSAGVAKENEQRVNMITGRLKPGQTLEASDAQALPHYLTAPQGVTPPAAPDSLAEGDQSAEMPGTVANAPSLQARNFRYVGTDKQQTDEENKRGMLRLIQTLPADSPERRALEYEQVTGKNAPTGMFGPKAPTTGNGSYMLDGKPIVGLHTNGRIVYQGQDVTDRVTPFTPPQHDAQNNFQLQPEIDPATGKQTGRFLGYNTKANRWEPVGGQGPEATKAAPGAAQAAQADAAKKDALGSLNQLDTAIDDARDLVGPGAGRVSKLEQLIGNPDPRISALGTKLLLTKMQVDHAASGSVRAGASPALLARWDNLLSQNLTPENLKAAVKAMREILGGGTAPAAPAAGGVGKPTAADLIRKYGG